MYITPPTLYEFYIGNDIDSISFGYILCVFDDAISTDTSSVSQVDSRSFEITSSYPVDEPEAHEMYSSELPPPLIGTPFVLENSSSDSKDPEASSTPPGMADEFCVDPMITL